MLKTKTSTPEVQDDATEADLLKSVTGNQTMSSADFESELNEDAIRSSAYALYEAKNDMNGSTEDDWINAETRLMQIGSPGV